MTKTAGTPKQASGIIVYLMEELGDARLRCAQLKRYIKEATDLIEKSDHRDHFFEVAGHLIQGVPDLLMRLDHALDASAMAASRLDYDEIKNGLKPEKAEELENVLQDVRLRYLNRRSNEETSMNAKTAAYFLTKIAAITATTGRVPTKALMTLIAKLEGQDKTAAALAPKAASAFRGIAAELVSQKNPSRVKLAATLRRILADTMEVGLGQQDQQQQQQQQGAQQQQQQAGSGCGGECHQQQQQGGQMQQQNPMAGAGTEFQKANPAISDEEAKVIDEMHDKHKDVIKDKQA